jgi:UDPglucose 6-dehydrogenase
MKTKKTLGFIGQGFIGKNYSDDFEERGYEVVRYARGKEFQENLPALKKCKIVFIAVPTPTTPEGFDDSILRDALKNIGDGATVVIKSTLAVGTTDKIQKDYPKLFIMHSPEFLTERTAAHDARHPARNIIGIPIENDEYKKRAREVMKMLPNAPYETICKAEEAELIKHGGNNWFYFKVVYINMLYDVAQSYNLDWDVIKEAMAADSRIGSSHLQPNHQSGPLRKDMEKLGYGDYHFEPIHKSGRGAGGNCFIKDFESFIEMYAKHVGDERGKKALESVRNKNIDLMLNTEKDLDLLKGVYGDLDKFKE